MTAAHRFVAYATAFEQTYADDDWQRLEPHFADDAVYEVNGGPPMGGRFEGREQVLAQLRWVLDELDRRFDARHVEMIGKPVVGPDTFEMDWRATYTLAGQPDLVFDGKERASFRDGKIWRLEDIVPEGTDERIQAHLKRCFS